jgi:hypothetical protein
MVVPDNRQTLVAECEATMPRNRPIRLAKILNKWIVTKELSKCKPCFLGVNLPSSYGCSALSCRQDEDLAVCLANSCMSTCGLFRSGCALPICSRRNLRITAMQTESSRTFGAWWVCPWIVENSGFFLERATPLHPGSHPRATPSVGGFVGATH